jgi:hypothetical protein
MYKQRVAPLTNLFVGDIIVPTRPFSYCLKVRKINRTEFYEGFLTQRILCDRYDLSIDRQPDMKNKQSGHSIDIYQIGQDTFRNPHDTYTFDTPKYFTKWKIPTAQLMLF